MERVVVALEVALHAHQGLDAERLEVTTLLMGGDSIENIEFWLEKWIELSYQFDSKTCLNF